MFYHTYSVFIYRNINSNSLLGLMNRNKKKKNCVKNIFEKYIIGYMY